MNQDESNHARPTPQFTGVVAAAFNALIGFGIGAIWVVNLGFNWKGLLAALEFLVFVGFIVRTNLAGARRTGRSDRPSTRRNGS